MINMLNIVDVESRNTTVFFSSLYALQETKDQAEARCGEGSPPPPPPPSPAADVPPQLIEGYECTRTLIAILRRGLKGLKMYKAGVALKRKIAFPRFNTMKV